LPPDGFDDFVAARSAALLRTAWLLTGDTGRAEDLLQTALAATWRRWRQVTAGGAGQHDTAGGNPEAYVRRAIVTAYLSWWRRRWRGELPTADPGEVAPAGLAATPDLAGDVAARDAVRRALAQLSPQQRAVVVLRYVEDLSVADTAGVLGCSQATVKVQSHRGLQALRADPGLNRTTAEEVGP
jgi:RNA polymerase sigma-70 factor (sigma-E family)